MDGPAGYRARDPVLRLLPPDVPEAFERLPAAEQAWRGRAWIIMFGAGYDPDMAWAMALRNDLPWRDALKEKVDRVERLGGGDRDYPFMIKGRMDYEHGKVYVGDEVQ
jgi:hypothetical protein